MQERWVLINDKGIERRDIHIWNGVLLVKGKVHHIQNCGTSMHSDISNAISSIRNETMLATGNQSNSQMMDNKVTNMDGEACESNI